MRIDRFVEGLAIIKGLFADGPFDFAGKHYTITGLRRHAQAGAAAAPPFLIGGGGKRVLSIAAREADIVGVNFNLEQGAVNRATMQTGGASTTDEKIDWIKAAAGDRFGDLELNVTVFVAIVTDDPSKIAERIGSGAGMSADEVMESPHYLLGPIGKIVETLQQRRERYGFSYIAFSGDGFEALAPVVAKLAGTN